MTRPASTARMRFAWLAAMTCAAAIGFATATPVGADERILRRPVPSLFATSPARIRAAHDHPAHIVLKCATCHTASDAAPDTVSGTAATPVRVPGKERCDSCHQGAHARAGDAGAKVVDDACRVCHLGDQPPGVAPLLPPSPVASALHFSHPRHRAVACEGCHRVSDEGSIAMPIMSQCIECHRRASVATACRSCHQTRPDGRLVTDFPPAGQLLPKGPLLGMAHDRDWLVRHRWVAADSASACANCHVERDCEQCHDAPIPPGRVHGGDFLSLHPQQSRRAPSTCASCHTVQRFCAECHARLGLALGSAPSVGAASRVHPSAATWGRGGGHAVAARQDLSACVSCHAEQDCVVCHGATGIGQGVSPHGPGFLARCGTLERQNGRACRTCHGETSRICP